MKLPEKLKEAYQARDLNVLDSIINTLRFKCGGTYETIFNFFNKHLGISSSDYEELMMELDEVEA